MSEHIYAVPGATIESIAYNAERDLAGTIGVTITDLDDTIITARTTTGIIELDAGITAAERVRYRWRGEAPDTTGDYLIVWDDGTETLADDDDRLTVNRSGTPPLGVGFATAADVATRLGRELTAAQEATVEDVIAVVVSQIIDEVDRNQDWADALDPVPATLRALCVSKAVNALSRPQPAIASESLGAHSVTYARETDSGIFLSEQEKRLVRMAVYGTLTASSSPRALHDRLIDLNESRDVDEIEA